jgi:hypothetical protein
MYAIRKFQILSQDLRSGGRLTDEEQRRYVINAGGVGQARVDLMHFTGQADDDCDGADPVAAYEATYSPAQRRSVAAFQEELRFTAAAAERRGQSASPAYKTDAQVTQMLGAGLQASSPGGRRFTRAEQDGFVLSAGGVDRALDVLGNALVDDARISGSKELRALFRSLLELAGKSTTVRQA